MFTVRYGDITRAVGAG